VSASLAVSPRGSTGGRGMRERHAPASAHSVDASTFSIHVTMTGSGVVRGGEEVTNPAKAAYLSLPRPDTRPDTSHPEGARGCEGFMVPLLPLLTPSLLTLSLSETLGQVRTRGLQAVTHAVTHAATHDPP
jgi:hypothetical protein